MSVKLMTPEQIRNNLKTIALTWPEGVPWQQVDQVNALRAELKRRGEPIDGSSGPEPSGRPSTMAAMTTEELETELRALSTRDDEAAQTRFADIRFELRRRASAGEGEAPKPPRPSVTPRALELPTDEEVARSAPAQLRVRSPALKVPTVKKAEPKPAPTSVCGFAAVARDDGTVVLEYEILQTTGTILVVRVLDLADVGEFCAMMNAASVRALGYTTPK